MNKDVSIMRNAFLTNAKMRDCYYIISACNGMIADDFYYHAERDVNKNGHVLFTAETPRMVVGVLKGRVFEMPDGALSEIACFYVDGRYRHTGVGRALLAAYENYVIGQLGARRIVLHSSPTVRTLDFYKQSGYKIVGAQYLMAKDIVR